MAFFGYSRLVIVIIHLKYIGWGIIENWPTLLTINRAGSVFMIPWSVPNCLHSQLSDYNDGQENHNPDHIGEENMMSTGSSFFIDFTNSENKDDKCYKDFFSLFQELL